MVDVGARAWYARPMQSAPFRSSVGNIRACLDDLREADALLDAVPRTAAAERTADVSDQGSAVFLLGGLGGVAAGLAGGGGATPSAARELAEAVKLLRKVEAELGDHPAATEIQRALTDESRAVPLVARRLSETVRKVHTQLRDEFGVSTPALTNWTVNDAEDDAALNAAGLGVRSRVIKIAVVVLLFAAFYVYLLSQRGA